MSKIVYLALAADKISGGNKMTFRHVEALNALGLDAAVRLMGGAAAPSWFEHSARTEPETAPLSPSDILVFPEDSAAALRAFAGHANRKIIFCQNIYHATSDGLARLTPQEAQPLREFIACSAGVAAQVARYFDYERITVIPGFADERLFAPAPKERLIACIPRKRPLEAQTIRHMFTRLYRGAEPWAWQTLENVNEREVAAVMGRAAVFLSLNRLEGMSLTSVEAMASGCLTVGFTGLGAREYTSPVNGLWVDEDDCEACAEALVRAVEMAEAGAGAAALMRHAGLATARQWSHANFLSALESFWRERIAES